MMEQVAAYLEQYYKDKIAHGTLFDAFDFFNAVKLPEVK